MEIDNHTDDNPEIKVHCWNCGKEFYIKSNNYYAGRIYCSDKCKADELGITTTEKIIENKEVN